MAEHPNKTKYIQIAAVLALVGNAVLATIKVSAGLFSGSGALLGDGIDSFGDVLISIMTLVVVKLMAKPADVQHPWGHGRTETIATAILSFILFFMGAQLIWGSVSKLISGVQPTVPTMFALVATVISIAGKILLALIQRFYGKRSGSAMIMANAKNMTGDVLISVGVLIGLVISELTGSGIADSVLAILIGLWIMKTAIGIFADVTQELMDGHEDTEVYRFVFDAVKSVDGAVNPHRTRMRKIAGHWDIDLDIEVDAEISVREAHDIASKVEAAIKERLEDVYDIVVHIEPYGDDVDDVDEGFGLCEDDVAVQLSPDSAGEKDN
ncbi:cation transporter [Clostridia bacterium]|nr:cation transporter [Clostridia bacterium]